MLQGRQELGGRFSVFSNRGTSVDFILEKVILPTVDEDRVSCISQCSPPLPKEYHAGCSSAPCEPVSFSCQFGPLDGMYLSCFLSE